MKLCHDVGNKRNKNCSFQAAGAHKGYRVSPSLCMCISRFIYALIKDEFLYILLYGSNISKTHDTDRSKYCQAVEVCVNRVVCIIIWVQPCFGALISSNPRHIKHIHIWRACLQGYHDMQHRTVEQHRNVPCKLADTHFRKSTAA